MIWLKIKKDNMAKEKYWKVEKGIVKAAKLPGINHGKGEDMGYPQQNAATYPKKVKKNNNLKNI